METNLYSVLAFLKDGMDAKVLPKAEDVGRHLGEINKSKATMRGIRRMGGLYKAGLVDRLYPAEHNKSFEKSDKQNVCRYFLTEIGLQTLATAPKTV